jgi:SAM-dependent methyltransferase
MAVLASPDYLLQEEEAGDQTAWKAGRFGLGRGTQKLLFGQMYEDVENIEWRYFPRESRVFAIASAGCTAISLAADHCVTAVDINPVQLEYARDRAEGVPPQRGAAERLMAYGRRLFPLMGWDRASLQVFLNMEDPREQLRFWRERLDTRLFRAGINVVLSPLLLRTVYSSGFLTFLPKHFGHVVRLRLERCWATHPNRENPYTRALFTGELAPERRTRRALDIQFTIADAASYLESCQPGSFDAFTFSNILDGASPAYRQRLFAAARRAASPDAVAVLRSFAEPTGREFNNVAVDDRSPLWGVVDVRPARALEDKA